MAKVTVHNFQGRNSDDSDWVTSPRKATVEWLAKNMRGSRGYQIVPGTAEEVDDSKLDIDGLYNP
jgi:hypothetical protein